MAEMDRTPAIKLPILKLTLPLTSGSSVLLMQRRLNAHGFKVDEDSRFGFGCQSAVQKFQQSKGMKPTGVCDAECWDGLLKDK